MTLMGKVWIARPSEVFVSGLLLTTDVPFLSQLQSLIIPGHHPTLLGRFPANQHIDELSLINAISMNEWFYIIPALIKIILGRKFYEIVLVALLERCNKIRIKDRMCHSLYSK